MVVPEESGEAAVDPAENLSASRVICQTTLNSVKKTTSQIKKPPHRRSLSPINWFPRKKTDSFLKRKIKILQENGGMKSSLGETLGESNPHYCKIEREKIAAREAAQKAMEARKAAMVEASWCRILKASRLSTKEAELLLKSAEKNAEKAFEEASAMGVIMYDKPDCPRRPYEVETSPTLGGKALHTVTASFETEFEVDKEISAAVKAALLRLAKDPCSEKEEFNDILRTISQNPELNETLSEHSSPPNETISEFTLSSPANLVMLMLSRLKCLKEEELASIATIVATCGLSAALRGADTSKRYDYGSTRSSLAPDQMKKVQAGTELPSLDKFLVKHVSSHEKEVQEAKAAKKPIEMTDYTRKEVPEEQDVSDSTCSSIELPGLDKYLVKHFSKLEMEVEKSKTKRAASHTTEEIKNANTTEQQNLADQDNLVASSIAEREKEMENDDSDAHKMKPIGSEENMVAAEPLVSSFGMHQVFKENVDANLLESQCANFAASKPMSRIERSKQEALQAFSGQQSLETLLTRHTCRLEKEKTEARAKNVASIDKRHKPPKNLRTTKASEAGVAVSLDKLLVKHVFRLEKEKTAAKLSWKEVKNKEKSAQQSDNTISLGDVFIKHEPKFGKVKQQQSADQLHEDKPNLFESRRQARERELLEAWGGLSLGYSVKPHLSKLEREKAAWKKAEEDERRRARAI